jgi:hypothetical protein
VPVSGKLWTLLGGEVGDELRGRVFGFVETGGRGALLTTIAIASVLVGLDDVPPGIPAARVVPFGAGVAAGLAGLRPIDDRPGVPVLPDSFRAVRHSGDESPFHRGRTTPARRGRGIVRSGCGGGRSDRGRCTFRGDGR